MDQTDNPWAGGDVNTSSDDWYRDGYFISHLTIKEIKRAMKVFNEEKKKGWNNSGPPQPLLDEAKKRNIMIK